MGTRGQIKRRQDGVTADTSQGQHVLVNQVGQMKPVNEVLTTRSAFLAEEYDIRDGIK
jgi:hypothetical protein